MSFMHQCDDPIKMIDDEYECKFESMRYKNHFSVDM